MAPVKVNLGLIRKIVSEEDFVERLGRCPECFGVLKPVAREEGVVACSGCGREFNDGGEADGEIPISEEFSADGHSENHWNPEASLAFGYDLGTNSRINVKAMCRIIAANRVKPSKCPSCGVELPSELGLRAHQMHSLTNKVEHPSIRSMLGYASQLCNDYGLHSRGRSCLVFAENLGRWVRAVGATAVLRGDRSESKRDLVKACFSFLVGQYYPAMSGRVEKDLAVPLDDVEKVKFLAGQYRLRRKDGGAYCVREPSVLAVSLAKENGLFGDEGFKKAMFDALIRAGLDAALSGQGGGEEMVKAVFCLAVEKRFGVEKGRESAVKLGVDERVLGRYEGVIYG